LALINGEENKERLNHANFLQMTAEGKFMIILSLKLIEKERVTLKDGLPFFVNKALEFTKEKEKIKN